MRKNVFKYQDEVKITKGFFKGRYGWLEDYDKQNDIYTIGILNDCKMIKLESSYFVKVPVNNENSKLIQDLKEENKCLKCKYNIQEAGASKERHTDASASQEFIITWDNDGHSYVIPYDKEDDWDRWINSQDYDDGVIPNYAKKIGGCISRVRFTNFKIY